VFQGIGEFFSPGHVKLIFQDYQEPGDPLHWFELAHRRMVDGMIFILYSNDVANFIASSREFLQQRSLPVVVVHSLRESLPCHSVGLDCRKGGALAVTHLIEHGYESIGFVSPGWGNPHLVDLRAGYREALQAHGMTFRDEWSITVKHYHAPGAYQETRALLQQGFRFPRALLISDDSAAYGMLKAFRDAGVNVPGEVALVGFGDSLNEDLYMPEMTSVRQPGREKGEQAAKLLFELVNNGRAVKPRTIILEPTLTVRETCGCKQTTNPSSALRAG
jgi:LacI family transcriptional regulator